MISHQFKTIIFDLDGTLIDTLTDIADAANDALTQAGYPAHPRQKYRLYVGDGLLTLAERMVPAGTPDTAIREIAQKFKTCYKLNWANNSRPYPGILTMLETLQKEEFNLAVLSNKPDEFTHLFVARFFPENTFAQVMGNRPNVPKKPDPTAALAIADYFGTEPAHCLLIGDSSVDMKTGSSAGMTSMGVSWGFRERQELEDSGADFIIDRPADIITHVLTR